MFTRVIRSCSKKVADLADGKAIVVDVLDDARAYSALDKRSNTVLRKVQFIGDHFDRLAGLACGVQGGKNSEIP